MNNSFNRSLGTLGAVFLVCALLAPSSARAKKGEIVLKNVSGYAHKVAYYQDDAYTDFKTLKKGGSISLVGTNIKVCVKTGGSEIGYVHFFKKRQAGLTDSAQRSTGN